MWNRCIAVRYLSTLICAIMFINILYQAISQSAQSKGALSRKSLSVAHLLFHLFSITNGFKQATFTN